MMAELGLKVTTNASEISALVERMAEHFDTAPDDDPAKVAMIEFGEIIAERDLSATSELTESGVVLTVALCPELQRIADMVSA